MNQKLFNEEIISRVYFVDGAYQDDFAIQKAKIYSLPHNIFVVCEDNLNGLEERLQIKIAEKIIDVAYYETQKT